MQFYRASQNMDYIQDQPSEEMKGHLRNLFDEHDAAKTKCTWDQIISSLNLGNNLALSLPENRKNLKSAVIGQKRKLMMSSVLNLVV